MKIQSAFVLATLTLSLVGCASSTSHEKPAASRGLLHDAVLSGPESGTPLYRESEPTEFGTRSTIKYRAMEF